LSYRWHSLLASCDDLFHGFSGEEQSLAALPRLLPTQTERDAVMAMVRKVLSAKGELSPARKDRLARVESIFMEPIPAKTGSRRGKA